MDALRSYRNSIEASGNAALNQRKITKSETAAIAAHTAMSAQPRRVSRSFMFRLSFRAAKMARNPLRTCEGDPSLALGTTYLRQLLQGLLHPPDAFRRLVHRYIERRTETHRLLARGEHHQIVLHHRLDGCVAQIGTRQIEGCHQATAANVGDQLRKRAGESLQLAHKVRANFRSVIHELLL